MKKKLAMVLLAVSLLMTACGKDAENANTDQTGTETQSQTQSESQSEPDAQTQPETQVPEGSDPAAEGNEDGYVPGVFTETGYESEYLGYRFTTPEGFTMTTEEELATLMGLSMELLSGDFSEAQMQYAQMASIYDMMAANEAGSNVNVVLQNVDTTGITLELMAETMMNQISALTTMECVVSDEYEIVDFAGGEYANFTATVTTQGITMNQEYYISLKPDRVVNITFTYTDGQEADRDALVNAFAAY